jgi:hypothetical protein
MVQQFDRARQEEREHLQKINQWHREATLQESRIGA